MKLCSKCITAVWPFALVTVISVVVGGVTWLTLGLSDIEPMVRIGAAGGVFIAVEGTLVHYVVNCMRRHCKHGVQRVQTHRSLNSQA